MNALDSLKRKVLSGTKAVLHTHITHSYIHIHKGQWVYWEKKEQTVSIDDSRLQTLTEGELISGKALENNNCV